MFLMFYYYYYHYYYYYYYFHYYFHSEELSIGHLHDDIYYYDQSPSGFSFLVQIRTFVI